MSAERSVGRVHFDGLLVAGTAVVLTGRAVETALQAVLIAMRARRANGLPDAPAHRALAAALANARSAAGHADMREGVGEQQFPAEPPTVPAHEAARLLGVTDRHIRRLAPGLGGRKIAGRWFIDETALAEHIDGRIHSPWDC